MLEKYDDGASKNVYKILHRRRIMDLCILAWNKTCPSCLSLNPSQIQRKLFVWKSLRRKWSLFSAKPVMWRLFHLSIVGRSILSGTQFVCIKSKFTMTMRARTHRLKPAPFWPPKTSNCWVYHRTALTCHPVTSFYSRTSRKKCVINDFRRQMMLLKRPSYGGVLIGVEKQTQMMAVHQNIPSIVLLRKM